MKFGFFDDARREYVINSPRTPYPWINYLGTQGLFSLMSNTAGGYTDLVNGQTSKASQPLFVSL